MSYLVLARKFRPQTFSEVCGQEHVTRTLMNAIKRGKVAHAYLFAGPRGVGKTSVARIFSKALNCAQGPTHAPCMQCSNCREIAQGTNLAVREIDGASHNSVDNVRDLIDSFRAAPAPGSAYKIYIIDEVHMLSTAAFNALLKSLEEPPPNTVFMLATTEAHKIPETVISRCQRHDFRVLSQRDIEARLREIAQSEGLDVEEQALRMIARLSDGSMRDSQSLLERVQAFCEGRIDAAQTSMLLGTVERRALFAISEAIFMRDAARSLDLVNQVFSTGVNPELFLRDFVLHFRELLCAKFAGGHGLEDFNLVEDELVELRRQVESLSEHDVQDLAHLVREGADSAIRSLYPKYALEALVVRMATREKVQNIQSLIARLTEGGAASDAYQASAAQSCAEPAVSLVVSESVPRRRAQVPRSDDPPLEWSDFVQNVLGSGAKLLGEHLKRLSPEKFVCGELIASGPEFSVASLREEINKKKLEESLQNFRAAPSGWLVKLNPSKTNGGKLDGSLSHDEELENSRVARKKKSDVVNHPKIRSLQKAFPGSSIENVVLKESAGEDK